MTTFEITQVAAGTIRFRVRVAPGAKKMSVGGVHDGMLKVAVTQPPENGKANQAVVKLIAKRLGVSKSSIAIVAGQTSRLKTIEATGVSISEIQRVLVDSN